MIEFLSDAACSAVASRAGAMATIATCLLETGKSANRNKVPAWKPVTTRLSSL
jgi:hypothetical protein